MKTHITIAAGMLAANLASAALVGAASGAWSASATDHDGAVDELYSHLLGGANNYLAPDSIENRFANGGFLDAILVNGLDRLELYDLGSRAANTNFFGVRVSIGADSYELTLTPDSKGGAATDHYFASINDILAETGGPTLEYAGYNGGLVTETAMLDFFIYDASRNVTTYASGVGNTPASASRPAFAFNPDLLDSPGPSNAAPLPGSATEAIAFLTGERFQVWGIEDLPGQSNEPNYKEPDYNDRLFAFRITPVPEPSAYGIIGALALAILIGCRRYKAARL